MVGRVEVTIQPAAAKKNVRKSTKATAAKKRKRDSDAGSIVLLAGGRKIELERDDEHVAVDQQVAKRAGLDTRAASADAAPRPAGGIVLTDRATSVRRRSPACAKRALYNRSTNGKRAVLVALPEVRIEFDNPDQRRAVLDVLSDRGLLRHTISEDTDDWMVVRPTSGNGRDALAIANQVYERAHPAAASVRFLQFVPKPGVTR